MVAWAAADPAFGDRAVRDIRAAGAAAADERSRPDLRGGQWNRPTAAVPGVGRCSQGDRCAGRA
eukprot:2716392-Alexandrium_andersonii.AAC.1